MVSYISKVELDSEECCVLPMFSTQTSKEWHLHITMADHCKQMAGTLQWTFASWWSIAEEIPPPEYDPMRESSYDTLFSSPSPAFSPCWIKPAVRFPFFSTKPLSPRWEQLWPEGVCPSNIHQQQSAMWQCSAGGIARAEHLPARPTAVVLAHNNSPPGQGCKAELWESLKSPNALTPSRRVTLWCSDNSNDNISSCKVEIFKCLLPCAYVE